MEITAQTIAIRGAPGITIAWAKLHALLDARGIRHVFREDTRYLPLSFGMMIDFGLSEEVKVNPRIEIQAGAPVADVASFLIELNKLVEATSLVGNAGNREVTLGPRPLSRERIETLLGHACGIIVR